MNCPRCNGEDVRVTDTRTSPDGSFVKRRRYCNSCKYKFVTFERIEYFDVYVIKKNGSRVKFNRNKILNGITTACVKRDISRQKLEEIAATIERDIQNSLVTEISSNQIGDMVLNHLKTLDQVAYVRFASVYKEFSDIESFIELIENLDEYKGENI